MILLICIRLLELEGKYSLKCGEVAQPPHFSDASAAYDSLNVVIPWSKSS